MIENIRLSFRGILSHKLRSALTMLGIIIGIAAIITIVSTIEGTNRQIQQNLIGAGQNNVTIRLVQGDWEYTYDMGVPDGITVFDEESTRKQLMEINGVVNASVFRRRNDYDGIYHMSTSLNGGYVYGIDPSYFSTTGYAIRTGRGITADDVKHFRKVCILDEQSNETLFDGGDPLGRSIEIRGEPFTVIGTAVLKDSFEPTINSLEDYYLYHQQSSGAVYIPTSVWPLLYQYDEPQSAIIRCETTNDMTTAGKEAEDLLNNLQTANNGDTYSYKAEDLMQQARNIQQLAQSTNMMLIWIAAISLLVGGIGLMNIMLVSVTERTSEIGLKKAIGAKKKAILGQFLTEAVVLTSLGGILGVLAGIGLAQLINRINGAPVVFSPEAALLAVVFSMGIGILAGILPARTAANLDPIEALRRE
ncbi:MAG: ABC transporter permease [Solobacterium sp.]|nr:ABC transporter permease [Solobacterium sp.]